MRTQLIKDRVWIQNIGSKTKNKQAVAKNTKQKKHEITESNLQHDKFQKHCKTSLRIKSTILLFAQTT